MQEMTIQEIGAALPILGAVCAGAACAGIAALDSSRFVIKEYKIFSNKIRQDCTFAVLADLHNKRYGPGNEKLLRKIEEYSPDGILIAGDMITSRAGADRSAAEALLASLSEQFPIYYAHGNHESRLKNNPGKFHGAYAQYVDKLKSCHIRLLENARVALPQFGINLCVLELERKFFRRFGREEMPKDWIRQKAGKASADDFQILLAHNPDYFPEYAAWGADLVVSGHVHGGAFRLPLLGGVISPSFRLFPKYDGGLFCENGAIMALSRGLGMHTVPLRFCNPGELVILQLRSCPDEAGFLT